MRPGDVYYNCEIPKDEDWETTLATRPDLKIICVGKADMTNTKYSVNLMAVVDGVLMSKMGSGTVEEIEALIKNFKQLAGLKKND